MSYELTGPALADIDSIWEYTLKNWGIEQADAYIDGVFHFLDSLPQQRFLWRNFPEHKADSRSAFYREHVMYFGEKPSLLIVYRVLHSSQNPNLQLANNGGSEL